MITKYVAKRMTDNITELVRILGERDVTPELFFQQMRNHPDPDIRALSHNPEAFERLGKFLQALATELQILKASREAEEKK